MTDALGWRMKFGVIAPSTNTSVEPEFAMMQPPGITNHFGRMFVPDMPIKSDEDFEKLVLSVRSATFDTIDRVMTCSPGAIVLGVSAETFWGGAVRSNELHTELENHTKLRVTMGSHACKAAFDAYSAEKPIRNLGVLTPYMPVGDSQVRGFLGELGYEVVKLIGLRSPSPMLIAHESPQKMRRVMTELAASDCDAILQVGTNLACAQIAAEAEKWFEKPVIAINTATYWHALRENGFDDKIVGFGRLLEEW